jgi:hypothetical protein
VSRIDAGLEAEEREPVRARTHPQRCLAEAFALRDRWSPGSASTSRMRGRWWSRRVPTRLVQVFENLIGNAVGFSPPNTEVAVHGLRETLTSASSTSTTAVPGSPTSTAGGSSTGFFSFRDGAAGERSPHGPRPGHRPRHRGRLRRNSVAATDRAGGGARFTVRPARGRRPHPGPVVSSAHPPRLEPGIIAGPRGCTREFCNRRATKGDGVS